MGLFLTHQDVKFRVGDTIKVHQRIIEGGKERVQIFEGLVIKVRGHQGEKSFTVRKISSGIGVEKIYPIDSPFISKIEVVRLGKVRRAKLYYLRDRTGKKALKVKQRFEIKANEPKKKAKSTTKKSPKITKATGKDGGKDSKKVSSK